MGIFASCANWFFAKRMLGLPGRVPGTVDEPLFATANVLLRSGKGQGAKGGNEVAEDLTQTLASEAPSNYIGLVLANRSHAVREALVANASKGAANPVARIVALAALVEKPGNFKRVRAAVPLCDVHGRGSIIWESGYNRWPRGAGLVGGKGGFPPPPPH